MMKDLKWFDSLSDEDFRNGAVRDEIRELFRLISPPIKELDGTKAVVLFFITEGDREEFIEAVTTLKPNMVAVRI